MEDRRKLERFSLRLPAEIEVSERHHDNKRVLQLWTKNICSGGAFFHTMSPLRKGTRVKIDLLIDLARLRKPPNHLTQVSFTGKVLRAESHGMAISYDNGYLMAPLSESEGLATSSPR